jgi:glycosyltransferase involved in cell wall biosynthesis
MSPAVSVIIPIYNSGDYLRQTLASVFAQTFTDFEVIVIDDGNPQVTAPIVGPLIESGRIRYSTQDHQGQAAARNAGAAQAKGSLIAFLDHDDLWPSDKLSWQAEVLQQNPNAAAVVGACQYIDGQSRRISDWPMNENSLDFDSLFDRNPVLSPGQTLLRADALRQAGGFDTDIYGTDDLDLWFKLTRRSRVLMVNRLALYYRLHTANASRDFLLMLRNARRVGQRHLEYVAPASRPNARRRFDRFLYRYMGLQIVRQFKSRVRRGELRAAVQSLLGVGSFFTCALRTPDVPARILRDLLLRYWKVPAKPAATIA